MRTISVIAMSAGFFLLSGCGSSSQGNSVTTASLAQDPTPSSSQSPSQKVLEGSGGQVVADVISTGEWQGQQTAVIYVPSLDQYMQIFVSTGEYVGGNVQFSGTNEQGTVYADATNYGAIGKNVTYNDGVFYLSTEIAPASFNVGSACDGGECANESATVDNSSGGWISVEVISQPYNFSAIAPLSVAVQ